MIRFGHTDCSFNSVQFLGRSWGNTDDTRGCAQGDCKTIRLDFGLVWPRSCFGLDSGFRFRREGIFDSAFGCALIFEQIGKTKLGFVNF